MVGYEGWPLVINLIWLPPCKDKTIQDFISSLVRTAFCALFFYIFLLLEDSFFFLPATDSKLHDKTCLPN
ncbi:hypothetical protein NC651_017346 [Populus alba x Populus x berolinensis]|nr:hypothetical protein NC651_017346 [Populus alba x Populus x berolinensis]